MQLSQAQKPSQSRGPSQVPHRNSKLTSFLQDALGRKSRITLIAHVAATSACIRDTLRTLQVAQFAALVRNEVQAHVLIAGEQQALHAELEMLRGQVAAKQVRPLHSSAVHSILPTHAASGELEGSTRWW
jgi:hypothetical protein